jgi:hypothetical protein
MLEITVIMNSAVAEVFACKCCGGGLPDQNLEIQVRNAGNRPVHMADRFDLEGPEGRRAWTAVCPAGGRTIAPGDVGGLYAAMDEALWERFTTLVLYDGEGRPHRVSLRDRKAGA